MRNNLFRCICSQQVITQTEDKGLLTSQGSSVRALLSSFLHWDEDICGHSPTQSATDNPRRQERARGSRPAQHCSASLHTFPTSCRRPGDTLVHTAQLDIPSKC